MNPKIKKWLIKPLLITIASLSVIIGIAFVLLSVNQERIVNIALAQVNSQLQGRISIEESKISLFQHFPYVSVALHNGKIFTDKVNTSKPVGEFDWLYVGFNAKDLMQQHYNVKILSLRGGFIDVVKETNGKINLTEIANSSADTLSSSPTVSKDSASAMMIDLNKIVLKEMRISYIDKSSGYQFSTHIDQLTSSLKIDSTLLLIALSSDMKLNVTSATDSTLFRNKRFDIELGAEYQWNSKKLDIQKCHFNLEEAGFTISGSAHLKDTADINLRVKGDEQDFNLFTAFLPTSLKEDLKPYQYDGHLYFDAIARGKISSEQLPLIEVAFGCEDAWFLNTSANKKIDQLNFKGFFTNGKEHSLQTSEVHVLSVSARPDKGIFKGNFVVRDFIDPKTLVQINSELELKFLGEFFGIQDLKQIAGTIKLDMDFKELTDIQLPEESLNKLKEGIQSNLSIENLTFRIPGYPHAVRDMNVHAEMRDGKITLDSAVLKIGESDLRLKGSISDMRLFLHDRDKPVKLKLDAGSDQLLVSELLSYDTALARKWIEEVRGFNINLALETTPQQLMHPSPLPKGTFEMKNLRASFKAYPHTLKNLGATLMINDTLLRLRDFTGMIDSSDINFKGRIINYHLWFDQIKKGNTQIAFDFKSNRFAFHDVLSKEIRQYLPRGYKREQLNNVWLRSKIDLKYDTNFRFLKAHITNISAELKQHKLKLKDISGGVKYGAKVLMLDTLRGKIGNSDFDVSLKYYFKGIDRYNNKVSNSFTFNSKLIDADEISQYDLAPKTGRSKRDTTAAMIAKAKKDSSEHAKAFNIFVIPFSDFNAQVNIGKLKYNRLWIKDLGTKVSMREDHTITIDTLMMKVAGGAIQMRGKFNGSDPQKIFFRSRMNIEQVDLEKLLLKLDHFGQDVVINKNVKGKVSGQIKSYVQVHPDLTPIVSNSKAEMNVSIYNGSLVDFAPMQAISSYFKDKNLKLIRFDTLENKFTYANGVLDIPAMDINSSLGYIQLSGKQSFDLKMEYYVRVPMKMVTKVGFSSLFNRKQEEVDLQQIDEIEYIDKDKKIAFMNLKITGTPDEFKVGLGKNKGKK